MFIRTFLVSCLPFLAPSVAALPHDSRQLLNIDLLGSTTTPSDVVTALSQLAGIGADVGASATVSITTPAELDAALVELVEDLTDIESATTIAGNILRQILPGPISQAVPDVLQDVAQLLDANKNTIFSSAMYILLYGLAGGNYTTIQNNFLGASSSSNSNPPLGAGVAAIYPQASSLDAPYSVDEADLRAAMYIPPGFTYGKLPPVLFLPGTATIAGQCFSPNYGKLLKANGVADPVYVNIPGWNLGDAQVNAEYAAYAVNYIYSITGKKVNTVSFSQGSVDGQWALKYWPSTRSRVANKISLSPDYHGSDLAFLVCPGVIPVASCTPALAQQHYESQFIRTLRNNGGDSAYVPTTNIFSIFDEVVQPQTLGNASGELLDARNVGVANIELQHTCGPLMPGGTADWDHESIMYNALGYALAVDAITNGGPGNVNRIDVQAACSLIAAPGLDGADLLATEAVAPLALGYGFAYFPKAAGEPPIMPYAQKDTPPSLLPL